MPRPILAKIDLAALASNLNIVRHYAPKTHIWSVIKANGYGHSLNAVLQGLKKTDGFALLDLNDAVVLREKGWQGPILLLEGFFQVSDLAVIDHYRLTTVIHNEWQIKSLMSIIPKTPLHIYLKLNSGMNRLGFSEQALLNAWQTLNVLKYVKTITIMTHFACADMPSGVTEQMVIVTRASKDLMGPRCLANSAAILWHPQTHEQWVRPGIMLYGASPSGNWQDIATSGLQAVMTLQSELIAIQLVTAGGRIGYGSNYQINNTQLIGIVACGYADGYPRQAPTGTPVLVEGKKTHTIGMVSMDTLIVDLKSCPQAHIGSQVELWGKHIKIDEVAASAGTLGYELMSKLAQRVKLQAY